MASITGVVISGKKVGRQLGFPTANIQIPQDVVITPGIHAGYVIIGGVSYQSALYVRGDDIIEAFILDFSEDIYDKEVQVQILKKIRDNMNFKSDQEAIDQITKDVAETKEFFNSPTNQRFP